MWSKWAIHSLFFIIFVFSVQLAANIFTILITDTWIKPWFSGVKSYRSANCATTPPQWANLNSPGTLAGFEPRSNGFATVLLTTKPSRAGNVHFNQSSHTRNIVFNKIDSVLRSQMWKTQILTMMLVQIDWKQIVNNSKIFCNAKSFYHNCANNNNDKKIVLPSSHTYLPSEHWISLSKLFVAFKNGNKTGSKIVFNHFPHWRSKFWVRMLSLKLPMLCGGRMQKQVQSKN